MKGIIFTTFNQMIEDDFGLEVWDELIDRVDPPSGGAYTTVDTYEDAELIALVKELGSMTAISVPDLLLAFGEYAFKPLSDSYPDSIRQDMSAKEFLQSVHDVIHVEVKKLYPDAILPTFTYEDPAPDRLVMVYDSPRNMCPLAQGLIRGVAKCFAVTIDIRIGERHTDNGDLPSLELQFK
jgi:hypothetical protein